MRFILNTLFVLLLIRTPLCAQKEEIKLDPGNNHVTTSALAFTADNKYLLAGGFFKKFELQTGKEVWRARKKDTEVDIDRTFLIKVSPDKSLCLVTKLRKLEVWDINSDPTNPLKPISVSNLAESAACFSPSGDSIIFMKSNGEIVFTDSKTFESREPKKITDETPLSLSLTPDGRLAVIGTESGIIIIYNLKKNTSTQLKLDSKRIYYVDVSPDGRFLAASTYDGTIWLGKFPELEMHLLEEHGKGLAPVIFHPSGAYLASGGADRRVVIRKIPGGSLETAFPAHNKPVTALSFSPNGILLATGSENVPLGNEHDTKIWSLPGENFAFSSVKKVPLKQEVVKPDPVTVVATSSGGKRLALVIGNGAYYMGPLANPENDARAMKAELLKYGFEVMEYTNLNQANMKRVIDDFGEKLKGYDVGLVFYAGHGIQSKGYNYLIPIDADLKSEQDVEYDCTPADRILGKMEAAGTKVNIIILDACRNNPFERGWTRATEGKGLATMDAPNGSLIALATSPGKTASDGSGNNGLYTSAILESIREPGLNIMQIFQNVRKICLEKSGGLQRPWEATSLVGDFYF
jgi:hypothetical protein